MHNASTVYTNVAQESRACCPKAEGRVFADGMAAADGVEEVVEVIVAVGVTGWSCELLDVLGQRTFGVLEGIFFAILREVLSLHGVGERGDGVVGFGCERRAGDGDGVSGNLHDAFGAGE